MSSAGPENGDDRFICLGVITGAIGIRGEVRVKTFTEEPEGLADYGALASEDGSATFKVKAIRPVKGGAGVKFAGVNDRNAAEALKGLQLGVTRQALADIEDEETYYHVDLIGLEVRNAEGLRVGHIKAVHDFGGGDVIEVQPDDGGKTALVPFRKETVPEVEVDAGYAVISELEVIEARQEEGEKE